MLCRLIRNEDGQDLVEYALLIVGVALLMATLFSGVLAGTIDAVYARAAATV